MSTVGEPTALDGPAKILMVCTANQARSPLAEVIARDLAERRRLNVIVSSAGFLSEGAKAASAAIKAARARDLDLSRHRSRRLDQAIVEDADLILTMTRDHVLDLVAEWPAAASRTFALKELRRLADQEALTWGVVELRSWAARAASGDRSVLLSGLDDIKDPMGSGKRAFRRAADEIALALDAALSHS